MRREEPDPLQAVDLTDRGEEVSEVVAVGQIVAVGVDVLAQQRDLPDTAVRQKTGLPGDVVDGAANLAPTAVGDDAEGAELVAAVDDGDVRRDVGPGDQRADSPVRVYAHSLP